MDLKRFCADDGDPRSYLREPWTHKGFTYATNGHIVVRIPAPEQANAIFDHKVAESAATMFANFPATESGSIPAFTLGEECAFCAATGIAYAADCEDCDGDGWFEHGSHEYDCKTCDASGLVDAPRFDENKRTCHACYGRGYKAKRVPVGNKGAGFDAVYLTWIQALPGAAFEARGPDESGRFTFDGGEGLVMPMRER